MKKIVIAGFQQESNSFNPVVSGPDFFEKMSRYGDEIFELKGSNTPLGGILDTLLSAPDVHVIPAGFSSAQSGGPVDAKFVESVYARLVEDIRKAGDPDGVFLSLHGATQSTDTEDCCGHFLERLRKETGPDTVIAVVEDLHANVTERMFRSADVICGYRKYPHTDTADAGRRAALAGLRCIDKRLKKAAVRIPMIFPAGAYTTEAGPVRELMRHAAKLAEELDIFDHSVFQMQPWLDVSDAGSSILAYGDNEENLHRFTSEIAEAEIRLADEITPNDLDIAEVVKEAEKNLTGRPYVLCDASDSANAGATGDDASVLAYVLENSPNLRFAFALRDGPAAKKAHEIGVGKRAVFELGGTLNPASGKVKVDAYVRNVNDGRFRFKSKEHAGVTCFMGKTAVLQTGPVSVLVCEEMTGCGDPEMYRSCGMDLSDYQLIDVKACTSFREPYEAVAAKIFNTRTPGVASSDLFSLPFSKIPRPFFPFDPIEEARKVCKEI